MQQNKVTPLQRLIKRVCRNKVTLFIGSGFSIKAGAPSVYELIQKLIKDGDLCYDEDLKDLQLRDVASDFVSNEGRHELMKVLYKHFSFIPGDTSDQKLLASIPHFKTIFTTNYDSLIEDAYERNQRVVLTSSQGCSNDDCAPVKIYKIHGDISTMSDPESIIITNEDYDDYFNNKSLKVLWSDLKYACQHSNVVFLGYSLSDDNITQIVKEVRCELNGNVKQMYLIAPHIHPVRKEELKANKIDYISSTGEEFLNKVKEAIDNTIVKDFENAKLDDNRVFYEYLHQRGMNPNVQFGSDKNIIGDINSYHGSVVTTDFRIKASIDIIEAINNRMYNVSQNLPGTKLSLPAYEIQASALIGGELRLNHVLIANKDDWKKIWIMPNNELRDITIKIPSAGFMEKTQMLIFDGGEKTIGIKFDIKIGEMCFELKFDQDGNPSEKITVDTRLYEKYESSSQALLWVEVPLALYSGSPVNFQIFGIEEKPRNTYPLKEFKKIKRFYETVKRLELVHNLPFVEYENYSDDRLMSALILDSYYSKYGVSYGLVKSFNCELDISERNFKGHDLIQSKKPMLMAFSYINFTSMFNGYEFTIPYVNICFMHGVVREYRKINSDRYALTIIDEAEENLIYGSDTPVEPKENRLDLQS